MVRICTTTIFPYDVTNLGFTRFRLNQDACTLVMVSYLLLSPKHLSPLANATPPGTKPTLPELLKFACTDGRVVNIPVEIGIQYVNFGTFLLDDANGSRVKIIEHQHLNKAEQINTEILQEWLTGRGKQPVTWETLVEVLRDIELSTLASDIEAIKCPAKQG